MARTMTSREFNQKTHEAKKAAARGPVFITDRGRPSHVLLSMRDFERLRGPRQNLVDLLAQRDPTPIDFDPPRLDLHTKPADLS